MVPRPAPEPTKYGHLVWRFGRLDHATQFNCQQLLAADSAELETELEVFQDEPIYMLKRKRWLKFIPVAEMTAKGQKALGEVNEQEEGLWQLHLLRHRWRIWGYFEDPEFYFLFWDLATTSPPGESRRRRP